MINLQNKALVLNTYLLPAVVSNNLPQVKYIVAAGAKPWLKDKCEASSLLTAVRNKFAGIVSYFLTIEEIKQPENEKYLVEAAMVASQLGHLEIFKKLIDFGITLHAQDPETGNTPLLCSIDNGKFNIIQYILNKDADIVKSLQIRNKDFESCLHIAAYRGNIALLILLSTYLPKSEYQNTSIAGLTPFLVAVNAQHLSQRDRYLLVEYFLKTGTNVEETAADGRTALLLAALSLDADLVRLLLKHGANPERVLKFESDEYTPPDMTVLEFMQSIFSQNETNKDKYIERTKEIEAQISQNKNKAIAKNPTLTDLKSETSLSTNNNASSSGPVTGPLTRLFIEAASNGLLDIVKKCIDKSAAIIDQKNDEGQIALYAAAKNGHNNVVKFLLEKGANPNLEFKLAKAQEVTPTFPNQPALTTTEIEYLEESRKLNEIIIKHFSKENSKEKLSSPQLQNSAKATADKPSKPNQSPLTTKKSKKNKKKKKENAAPSTASLVASMGQFGPKNKSQDTQLDTTITEFKTKLNEITKKIRTFLDEHSGFDTKEQFANDLAACIKTVENLYTSFDMMGPSYQEELFSDNTSLKELIECCKNANLNYLQTSIKFELMERYVLIQQLMEIICHHYEAPSLFSVKGID